MGDRRRRVLQLDQDGAHRALHKAPVDVAPIQLRQRGALCGAAPHAGDALAGQARTELGAGASPLPQKDRASLGATLRQFGAHEVHPGVAVSQGRRAPVTPEQLRGRGEQRQCSGTPSRRWQGGLGVGR